MFEIQAETEVDAPTSVVWAVLTGLSAGPRYNFAPRVIVLQPEQRFTWRAITGVRGIFDGEHSFELAPLAGGRTRLRNREVYSGLLAPLLQRLPMMRDAPAGFLAMNQEIRARAEALSGA